MRFINKAKDPWRRADGEDGPIASPSPAQHLLLSLEQWHAVRESWPARLAVGVSVPNDADIEQLARDLPRLALVALHFPKWTDGRAYSQARLLRARFGFRDEVRATGDVLVDMLPLLQRTGFSSAQLNPGQSRDAAERALGFYAGHYQGDTQDNRPLFARPPGTAEALVHRAEEFVNAGASI